jgi:predicted nucleic acid-binding Zn ribbon protein
MKSIVVTHRTCRNCGNEVSGRSDKKFCSDNCRTGHANRARFEANYTPFVRRVNRTLVKNRKVLESVLASGQPKVTKSRLLDLGFDFTYHTHQFANGKGKTYYYCYEFGYLALENDLYLVVRSKLD